MSSLGEVGRFHQCQGWKPTYNSQLYNLPLFLVNSPGGQRKGDGCVLQPEPFREPTASPPHWPLSWVLWTQGRSLSWQPSSHDQWGQIPALQLGNWVLHSGSQSFLSHCFSIVTALKTHHVVPTQGTVCFLTLTSLVSACPRSLSCTHLWSMDSGWEVRGVHKLPGIAWTVAWVCALFRRAGPRRSPSHTTLPLGSDAPATLASFS